MTVDLYSMYICSKAFMVSYLHSFREKVGYIHLYSVGEMT